VAAPRPSSRPCTFVHPVTDVRVATDTITTTPNHPFRVAGRGWVAAGELAAGDTLYLADGGRADIVSVTREKLATPGLRRKSVSGFCRHLHTKCSHPQDKEAKPRHA